MTAEVRTTHQTVGSHSHSCPNHVFWDFICPEKSKYYLRGKILVKNNQNPHQIRVKIFGSSFVLYTWVCSFPPISSLSEVMRTSFVFSGSEDKVWCDKNWRQRKAKLGLKEMRLWSSKGQGSPSKHGNTPAATDVILFNVSAGLWPHLTRSSKDD